MILNIYIQQTMLRQSINFLLPTFFEIQLIQDIKGQGHYIKVKGHTMASNTFTTQPVTIPKINFLHFMVSTIEPRQDLKGQDHYDKVKEQSRSLHNVPSLNPQPFFPQSIDVLHIMFSDI